MATPGDYTLRCRHCEGKLGVPVRVTPEDYGVVPNSHGAVVRKCLKCHKTWLGFMSELPSMGLKHVMKVVDRLTTK